MKTLIKIFIFLIILNLTGCLGSGAPWRWSHPDPLYAQQQRDKDIEACEQETDDLSSRGPFRDDNSRPYGEWGDFIFEICMEDRGWFQTQAATK